MNNTPVEQRQELMKKFGDLSWGTSQLRNVSIFSNLKDSELTTLYQLGEIRQVKPKSYVMIEGESSRGMFIILSGTVSVFKNDASKDSLIRMAYLEQGAVFGEFSLFDDAPRSATIAAETDCFLFHLGEKGFNQFLIENGDNTKFRFYKRCAEEMAERFRKQNEDFVHSQQLLWKHALDPKRKIPSNS